MNENQIFWIGFTIIILGVGSLILFWPSPEDTSYNGFEFSQGPDGFYYVEINTAVGDQVVPFYHHPSELEDIPFNQSALTALAIVQNNQGNVKIALDTRFSNDSYVVVAGVEVSKITGKVFYMPTTSAFTEPIANITKYYTCDNASPTSYVVLFNQSDENRIDSIGYCTVLQATTARESVKLANLLVYKALGVMK